MKCNHKELLKRLQHSNLSTHDEAELENCFRKEKQQHIIEMLSAGDDCMVNVLV